MQLVFVFFFCFCQRSAITVNKELCKLGVLAAVGLLVVSLVCVLAAELSLNPTERRDATKLCALTVVQPLWRQVWV